MVIASVRAAGAFLCNYSAAPRVGAQNHLVCSLVGGVQSSCVISPLQVHRKTLNPVFNETFQFGVPLNELHSRKLHFSVYDFDRFSRHDLIGQVVVDNLLDFSEGSGDKPIWRDIVEGTAVRNGAEPLPGDDRTSLVFLPGSDSACPSPRRSHHADWLFQCPPGVFQCLGWSDID